MELEPKAVAAAAVLVVLWALEGFIPFYEEFPGRTGERVRHDLKNLGLGGANALLMALLAGGLFLALDAWGEAEGWGLFRVLEWPGWVELILVILVFDLWMYLWHRANHRIPFLWRFHRMHHSDPEMDASTGLRFHPGEQLLSGMARLLVIPLLGVSIAQLAVYEALLLPVILFHHSNLSIPDWLDRGLRGVVVTPAMHRVHHSRWQPETDSNYGSVFPWWDRLLGSFRLREDARTIQLGLDEFDGPAWQSLGGMLRTPLASLERREGGAKPQGSPPGSPMGD
jgi:sterol desaturase/sphingolipid hydroxylase (fatty acid hydroxylase superfamily)